MSASDELRRGITLDETREVCIWLVWVLDKSGETMLRSVDLTENIADRHVRALKSEGEITGRNVKVYKEASLANHFYAGLMNEAALSNARQYMQSRRTGD